MNALQVMDRYWKEVLQVSTWKHDVKVQYFYDKMGHQLLNIVAKTLFLMSKHFKAFSRQHKLPALSLLWNWPLGSFLKLQAISLQWPFAMLCQFTLKFFNKFASCSIPFFNLLFFIGDGLALAFDSFNVVLKLC